MNLGVCGGNLKTRLGWVRLGLEGVALGSTLGWCPE